MKFGTSETKRTVRNREVIVLWKKGISYGFSTDGAVTCLHVTHHLGQDQSKACRCL